jgi:hypothetical protein
MNYLSIDGDAYTVTTWQTATISMHSGTAHFASGPLLLALKQEMLRRTVK